MKGWDGDVAPARRARLSPEGLGSASLEANQKPKRCAARPDWGAGREARRERESGASGWWNQGLLSRGWSSLTSGMLTGKTDSEVLDQ